MVLSARRNHSGITQLRSSSEGYSSLFMNLLTAGQFPNERVAEACTQDNNNIFPYQSPEGNRSKPLGMIFVSSVAL